MCSVCPPDVPTPQRSAISYSCSGDGYLGWTWLPWTHDEGDDKQALIINHDSMPGGAQTKYSLGYTLVHEMGEHVPVSTLWRVPKMLVHYGTLVLRATRRIALRS